MDSATSVEFKFHMDLTKKLHEVVADIICGNSFFIVLCISTCCSPTDTDIRRQLLPALSEMSDDANSDK